jgi:hypothetical protein
MIIEENLEGWNNNRLNQKKSFIHNQKMIKHLKIIFLVFFVVLEVQEKAIYLLNY